MGYLSDKLDINDKELIEDLKMLIVICIGMFLFILFIQPFNLEHLEFNDKLLLVTGIATISFLFLCLFYIILPRILPVIFESSEWESRPDYVVITLICIFNTVALTFYLRYVGLVTLSMFLVFKIVLICLLPPFVLRQICTNKSLNQLVQTLMNKNKELHAALKEQSRDKALEPIEIISENNSEKIELLPEAIVTIKSADNYIEIFYLENNVVKKLLFRSSLKNIEEQLKDYNLFQRCHRTSIINIKFAEKLIRNINGYSLVLKNFEQEIPVSRQYLLKVKDALNKE